LIEQTLRVDDLSHVAAVFGAFDENLKLIEKELAVQIVSRSEGLRVSGEPVEVAKAVRLLRSLLASAEEGETVNAQSIRYLISQVTEGTEGEVAQLSRDVICVTYRGKPIKAKTLGQKNYVEAIKKNTITLGIGPAGTGKTYLAVAAAVTALREKAVNRIVLTRPAIEAGEKLGFLPGDLQSKIDPYLRPLYDSLFEMLGTETYAKYVERGNIEIAPLAYMRGRTLDDSFIILDEAQNTSPEQMKMFLTRLGFNSKAVINGDVTQIDLPAGTNSGLKEAVNVLDRIEGIGIITLTDKDVVRHELVQRIIRAYEEYGRKKPGRRPAAAPRSKKR
jgi:phosphate starvation-inducible PhoH-like protein